MTGIWTRVRKNFCCSLLMKPIEAVVSPGAKLMLYSFSLRLKSAARNAELFGGERALAARALQSFNDHLLFHAVEIADRHGSSLTQSGRLSRERGAEPREVDLGAGRFHRHLGDQVSQFANVSRPGMRKQRGNRLRGKILARSFQAQEMFGKGNDILGTLPQRRNAELESDRDGEINPAGTGPL